MVVLDYKREVWDWQGFAQFLAGLLPSAAYCAKFHRSSASKQKPPPLPPAPSKAAPAGGESENNQLLRLQVLVEELSSARDSVFATIVTAIILTSNGVWKRLVNSLPIRRITHGLIGTAGSMATVLNRCVRVWHRIVNWAEGIRNI